MGLGSLDWDLRLTSGWLARGWVSGFEQLGELRGNTYSGSDHGWFVDLFFIAPHWLCVGRSVNSACKL